MKIKKKILLIIIAIFSIAIFTKGIYAASASVSANKTSVTVGEKVTITVKVNAAAWNLKVSGGVTDSIVGFNMDAVNESTTKTYTLDTSKAGTYTVSLSGDITDESSDNAQGISDSVTVTVKEKPVENTNTNTNTNTNNNTGTSNNTQTTTKKSSNANISKLALSVEGLSFNKKQTTYSIKVGEDVEHITVTVTLESKKASYKVTGNKNLVAGNNVIKIVVTAEDGTKKTYKINVEKKGNPEDTSAELSNLIIENMTFDKPFSSLETEYYGGKIKYTEKLIVLAYPVSEKSEYEILGNENLKEGENTIIVKVTSYDETSVVEYKVTFEMMSEEETNALQVISPNVNETKKDEEKEEENTFKQILIDNSTIILLYLLALIEFAQVVYLYIELKNVNPEAVTVTKRRKKQVAKTSENDK